MILGYTVLLRLKKHNTAWLVLVVKMVVVEAMNKINILFLFGSSEGVQAFVNLQLADLNDAGINIIWLGMKGIWKSLLLGMIFVPW